MSRVPSVCPNVGPHLFDLSYVQCTCEPVMGKNTGGTFVFVFGLPGILEVGVGEE